MAMNSNESAFADFIKVRIEKCGDSVQVKYLSQLLSTLSPEIRNSVASNATELMKFLRKHPNLFKVDASGNVKLQTEQPVEPLPENNANDSRSSSLERENKLPDKLMRAEGVIIKQFPTHGFINMKNPFKTTVYFTPACFGDRNKSYFSDFDDLTIGTKVCFNARRNEENKYCRYRAIKVWFPIENGEENIANKSKIQDAKNVKQNDNEQEMKSSHKPIQSNTRKTRETGLYDPVDCEGDGKILRLFPNYGFIMINEDPKNTVFFYKDHISNYENILDLTKILRIDDIVEFKAVRAAKQNIKARWSATQVWIKKTRESSSNLNSKSEHVEVSKPGKGVSNEPGKIFPHASGTIIKFGKNYSDLADADESLFFMLGAKVIDVGWEFSDGDNVYFDAYKIKSHPGWKATLVWTGNKPDIIPDSDFGGRDDFLDEVESVPDSESYISKSSENSGLSEFSNKSVHKFNGKSSGYSSLKVSRESINSSQKFNSVSKKSREIVYTSRKFNPSLNSRENINNSKKYNLSLKESKENINSKKFNSSFNHTKKNSNQESFSRTSRKFSSSPNESRENINRFKKFNSHRRKRSSNRIENDEMSDSASCSSKYSNISTPEAGGRYPRYSNRYVLENNFKDKSFHEDRNSNGERSKKSSQELLRSSNNSLLNDIDDNHSVKSNSSLTISSKNTKYLNWGDSPYPGEDDEYVDHDSSDKYSLPEFDKDVIEDELSDNEKDIFNSDDDFNDDVQEFDGLGASTANSEQHELKESDLTVDNETEQEPKKKASITHFHDLEGTIVKVYCRYANIQHPKITTSTTFFWHDLYQNRVPVSDSGVDDLREVVKVGDVLKFNCLQIITDEQSVFTKVTMVWMGAKPIIEEITAQQFIAEIGLSITLGMNDVSEYSEGDSKSNINKDNNKSDREEPSPPIQKFLTTVSDSSDEESVEDNKGFVSEDAPMSDSISQDASNTSSNTLDASNTLVERTFAFSNQLDEINQIEVNESEVIEGISKILKSNILTSHSKHELGTVSAQIVQFILKSHIMDKCPSCSTQSSTELEVEEKSSSSKRNIQFTDTESQTIFTGEVIGKSIYFP